MEVQSHAAAMIRCTASSDMSCNSPCNWRSIFHSSTRYGLASPFTKTHSRFASQFPHHPPGLNPANTRRESCPPRAGSLFSPPHTRTRPRRPVPRRRPPTLIVTPRTSIVHTRTRSTRARTARDAPPSPASQQPAGCASSRCALTSSPALRAHLRRAGRGAARRGALSMGRAHARQKRQGRAGRAAGARAGCRLQLDRAQADAAARAAAHQHLRGGAGSGVAAEASDGGGAVPGAWVRGWGETGGAG